MEQCLESLEWNGVEEREELEGRRSKLAHQLEEATALKVAIDRRSTVVADYVHIYLGKERRKEYCAMIATKVKLMVGLKEVQEQVSRRGWVTLPRWSSPTARPAPSGSSGSASCSQKSSS